jgi:hypothetical protein
VKRTIALVLGVLLIGSAALAATGKSTHAAKPKAAQHPMTPSAEDVKWGAAPPVLPAGAQMAVLDGDPGGKGTAYTLRLKLPDGYKIMPHTHPAAEHVTVLAGTFNVGMGKAFDAATAKPFAVGGYGTMPANMAHYASATGETIVQVHGLGPFALTYVNPSDDPTKKK